MSKVAEIQSALKELTLNDAQQVAQWLQDYLDQHGAGRETAAPRVPVKLPDYAARRKLMFGDKVQPNMVLLAREQERW